MRRKSLVAGLPSNDRFRWIPRFYAVRGDKGTRWCVADNKSAAKTVYRRSEPVTPRGTPLQILVPSQDELTHGIRFWMRLEKKVHRFFYETRTDMAYTAELPWPGEPGYQEWYDE